MFSGGFRHCIVDHFVFIKQTIKESIILVVYVDDILLTSNDTEGIHRTKEYLDKVFQTKDIGRPGYFLSIKFAYSKGKLILSQCKYALDLLIDIGCLGCKPESMPIEQRL